MDSPFGSWVLALTKRMHFCRRVLQSRPFGTDPKDLRAVSTQTLHTGAAGIYIQLLKHGSRWDSIRQWEQHFGLCRQRNIAPH